jgi:hypothetical protein
MRLAEFPTMQEFNETWLLIGGKQKVIRSYKPITIFNGYYTDVAVFTAVGRTQANGDGTDSWCGTGALVPTDMLYNNKYQEPVCDVPSALYAYFFYYDPYLVQIFDMNMYSGQFLCSEL